MGDWLSLVRPEFPAMTFAGVFSGAAVAAGRLDAAYAFAAVGPVLITAASFALNDFYDVPSDRALGRTDRPLVRGALSPKQVLFVAALLFGAGLYFCYAVSGLYAFAIAFAYCVLAFTYNAVLKRTLFVGNAVVATTYSIPFIYGNVVATGMTLDSLHPFVATFAAISFLAGLARELYNSVKDKAGDAKLKALTLPMVVGDRPVILLGSLMLAGAVALSVLPLLAGLRLPYLLLVGACDLLLLKSAVEAMADHSYESLRRVRKQTIYALLLGLLGFASLAVA